MHKKILMLVSLKKSFKKFYVRTKLTDYLNYDTELIRIIVDPQSKTRSQLDSVPSTVAPRFS